MTINNLILNNITAKVTLGAKPFTRTFTYWKDGNIFSYYNNDVIVQGRTMSIEVPYSLAIIQEDTGTTYLKDLVDEAGNIIHPRHTVVPKKSYSLEGFIAPNYTWLEYFYDSLATAGAKRGYEFFFNCQNGMIAQIIKELFPEVSELPNVELMPYDSTGGFNQLIITKETINEGMLEVEHVLGAKPFTHALNGSSSMILLEGDNTLVITDSLGNIKTKTINYVADIIDTQ